MPTQVVLASHCRVHSTSKSSASTPASAAVKVAKCSSEEPDPDFANFFFDPFSTGSVSSSAQKEYVPSPPLNFKMYGAAATVVVEVVMVVVVMVVAAAVVVVAAAVVVGRVVGIVIGIVVVVTVVTVVVVVVAVVVPVVVVVVSVVVVVDELTSSHAKSTVATSFV
jgi:hypothetical protein